MRLDPEVAAAAEQLRRERHIGLGEAVNELARAGLARGPQGPGERHARFVQRTAEVGIVIDVSDVAGALEQLDALDAPDAQGHAHGQPHDQATVDPAER